MTQDDESFLKACERVAMLPENNGKDIIVVCHREGA